VTIARAYLAALVLLLAALIGCTSAEPERPVEAEPVEFNQALADELIAMQAADQEGSGLHEDRQARLEEIFDEYGWPGHDLVGEAGSTAAWVIAQHSDLDLAFQERALELLTEAVEADNASPGDLATSATGSRWRRGSRRPTAPRSAATARSRCHRPRSPIRPPWTS
jgi:hypothetical protein